MLICKNCFGENPDGTVRCMQCNMAGNFVYKSPSGIERVLKLETNPLHCTNCGSEAPGEESRCMHCHFPMPIHTKTRRNGKSHTPSKVDFFDLLDSEPVTHKE